MLSPERRHRRSIRLKGYDYSRAGAYFITFCTRDRACLFGDVEGGMMRLKEPGRIVDDVWRAIPNRFPNVTLDEFVVMPNHVHGIVVVGAIHESPLRGAMDMNVGAIHESPLHDATDPADNVVQRRRMTIPLLVGRLKSVSAKRINEMRGTPGVPVWQRNYYEHIIRDDESLNHIRQYIHDNPAQWSIDRENPINVGAVHEPPLHNPKDVIEAGFAPKRRGEQ